MGWCPVTHSNVPLGEFGFELFKGVPIELVPQRFGLQEGRKRGYKFKVWVHLYSGFAHYSVGKMWACCVLCARVNRCTCARSQYRDAGGKRAEKDGKHGERQGWFVKSFDFNHIYISMATRPSHDAAAPPAWVHLTELASSKVCVCVGGGALVLW